MALPLGTTGSLSPTFVPARPVRLAVKLPSAFTLFERFPSALREPLGASVTFSERRPSQTARLRLSGRVLVFPLEFNYGKGGIPTMTPLRLAP